MEEPPLASHAHNARITSLTTDSENKIQSSHESFAVFPGMQYRIYANDQSFQ